MSISPLSFTAQNYQAWQTSMRQRQEDFQTIASSLQSGDLTGAQQAYAALESTLPSTSSSTAATSSISGTTASTGTSAMSAVQQEFAVLGQDLSSGNLTQAQQDFTQLTNDFQTAISQNGGAPHHDEHGCSSSSQNSSSQGSSSQGSSAQSDSTSANDPMSLLASNLLAQYGPGNGSNSSTASRLLGLIG